MKAKTRFAIHIAALLCCAATTHYLISATATKTGVGTDLTGGTVGVWSGGGGASGSPTSSDSAIWTSSSLGAGLTLGSAGSWAGIRVSGALTDIDITGAGTLTMGEKGIDMGSSPVNLSIANPLALIANQMWVVKSGKELTQSGAISGNHALYLNAVPGTVTYASYLPATPDTAIVFAAASLASFDGAAGILGGSWFNGGSPIPGAPYFFRNDGTTATVQLQALDDVYTKCMKVELTQSGSDIVATVLYAKYVSGKQLGIDFDTTGSDAPIATAPGGDGYGVAALNLTVASTVTYSSYLPATPDTVIVFTDASLANFDSAAGIVGGSWFNGGNPIPAAPYFFQNDGTTATVQLQALDDVYSKCMKVELTQSGSDIVATVLYGKYVSGKQLGIDFDTTGSEAPIATAPGGDGYGVAALSLSKGVGTGTISLSGANSHSGGTTLNIGQLNINSPTALGATSGALTINGGLIDNTSGAPITLVNNNPQTWNATVNFLGTTNLNLGTGPVTLTANREVIVTANDLTVGGSIGGAFALTKSGSGRLTLSGKNTYSGGTTVSFPSLRVGAGGASGDLGSGPVTLGSFGLVASPNVVFDRSDNPTFPNALTTGPSNPGRVSAIGAAAGTIATLSGPITATASSLWICGPGTIHLANTTDNDLSAGVVIASGGVLSFGDTKVLKKINDNGSGLAFNSIGGGTLRYTGSDTEITQLDPVSALGTSTNRFEITQASTVVTLPNALVDTGVAGIWKAGSGTLVLAGANTYTGATMVEAGTLLVNGSLDAGEVSVATAGTLGGNGTIPGPVTVDGKLSPNGTLTLQNTLTLSPSSSTYIDVNANGNSDFVRDFTSASYDGNLVVSVVSGSGTLAIGKSFQIFSTGGTGNFTSITPAPGAGLGWSFDAASGVLSVVKSAGPQPANMAYNFNKGELLLNWPSGQGWRLQAQTNSLSDGLTGTWHGVAGATPPYTIMVNPANPTVFYRLVYP